MPDRNNNDAASNHDMVLGELRGQMREVVHSINGLSQKFDALSREVIGLGPLAADVAELRMKVGALEAKAIALASSSSEISQLKSKVSSLEMEKNQRDGAAGVIQMILKSPTLGWIVGAAISAWAILTGRVNI